MDMIFLDSRLPFNQITIFIMDEKTKLSAIKKIYQKLNIDDLIKESND